MRRARQIVVMRRGYPRAPLRNADGGCAGRNRVARVRMPRVAGEHGLRANRDMVMQGT